MDPKTLEACLRIAEDHVGLSLGKDAERRVRRAVEKLVERGVAASAERLLETWGSSPELEHIRGFVAELVSDETYFFRNQHPFVGLREEILPRLFERSNVRRIHIWSAACSTGQELYSIAMMLHRHFPERWPEQFRCRGTDISEAAIEQARSGRYSQLQVNRGLPADYLTAYFESDGIEWQVVPEIRDHVSFHRTSLLKPLPVMPRMDVVFLRNLLVYYDDETSRQMLQRVAGKMARHGVLVGDGVKAIDSLHDGFELVRGEYTRFYRRV